MRLLVPLTLAPDAFAPPPAGAVLLTLGGATMGTRWSVKCLAPPPRQATLANAIELLLHRLVGEMSQWEPDSALSHFNRAPAGSWHALPPALFAVLTTGLDLAARTDGAFDPGVGALSEAWGFGASRPSHLPPGGSRIEAARAAIGWRRIDLDRGAQRALQPGVALDLSGIGKGYAVDAVAALLRDAGIVHHLVEIGGELVGGGLGPGRQPWWVDLETAPDLPTPPLRVGLHALAAATSGHYRRWLDHDGHRLSHSLDPRTGGPAETGLASVSVIHPSCMMADGWATALIVLGMEDGLALAERESLAARFVTDTGEEHLTTALAAMAD